MNTAGMQIAQTIDSKGVKVRNHPSDTNLKAMSMGSWHASLSRGGLAHPAFKGKSGQGNFERKGKVK